MLLFAKCPLCNCRLKFKNPFIGCYRNRCYFFSQNSDKSYSEYFSIEHNNNLYFVEIYSFNDEPKKIQLQKLNEQTRHFERIEQNFEFTKSMKKYLPHKIDKLLISLLLL